MARGVDGRETFVDDQDRRLFLGTLLELKRETPFTLLAYCLMENHFHLAIKIDRIPLCRILQRLLTRYVPAFNSRHDRTGHLFQARYKAVLCLQEAYLVRLIDYIHNNPVRAGLVDKADQWAWSSQEAYSKGLRAGLVDTSDLPVTLELGGTTCGTSDDFEPWPKESREKPILPRHHPAERADLDSLAEPISVATEIPIDVIRSSRRGSTVVRAKRAFITAGLGEGYTLSEIARWLRCSPSGAHYLVSTGANLKELKA